MLLIQNGLVYTMENDKAIYADVLIKDKKIVKISNKIEARENMRIIDASGKKVLPGFIDAHSHIGIARERSSLPCDESNEGTNPIIPAVRALDGINPMDSAFHNALAVGITSVMVGPGSANVIGGQFAVIKTSGRAVDEMLVKAPSAMKIAFGENPMLFYGNNGNPPSTRMGIASMIREELFKARKYFNSNVEKDFQMEAYLPLFERKIPLKAHVHRADDILTAIRIAKEFNLKLTLDHCTEGHLVAEDIAKSGYPVIFGPALASRTKEEVSLSDFKTAGVLAKAGVMLAITMDHPVTRIQYLPMSAALAAKEGLGEWEALKAITINPAKICGIDDKVGSISEGKDADLVIYDGSPLDLTSTVCATIVNGKLAWPD